MGVTLYCDQYNSNTANGVLVQTAGISECGVCQVEVWDTSINKYPMFATTMTKKNIKFTWGPMMKKSGATSVVNEALISTYYVIALDTCYMPLYTIKSQAKSNAAVSNTKCCDTQRYSYTYSNWAPKPTLTSMITRYIGVVPLDSAGNRVPGYAVAKLHMGGVAAGANGIVLPIAAALAAVAAWALA